jgi:flagellar hook-associated protein 1 FlgK
MLTTGVSALQAFQRAMDTVSHNVSNANTAGYSRQIVDLASLPADTFGVTHIGNGVTVASIRRLYDAALASQVNGAGSALKQLDIFATYADRVDKLFSDSATGLSASLQQFSNALETVATSPTSATARQVLISQAQTLVNRFQSYQGSLDSMGAQLNAQLVTETSTVSELASSIADLNQQIILAQGSGRSAPNDLLDQRDRLVTQLGEHIGVNTVIESNGGMNVYLGSGQALVNATTAFRLQAAPGEFDRGDYRLTLGGYAVPVDVTSVVSGGTLGGLLQLRTELLQPAANELGQIAVAVGRLCNQKQAAGIDLTGAIGADMFAIGDVMSFASSFNSGNAVMSASRYSLSALTAADYQLYRSGGAWSVIRRDTGATVAATGAGTSGSPLQFDGLSVSFSGTAQDGDTFLLRPTADAAAGMRALITAPERIAAAMPLLTGAAATNQGTGSISAGTLLPGGTWVRGNYTLSFSSTTAWQIADAANTVVATGSYAPGGTITFNGMQFRVDGAPSAGDSFTINDNITGKGDARNMRALIDALGSKVLNGGTLSAPDAAERMVGRIGVQSNHAAIGRDAQSLVLEDANSAQQAVSGVNLDEEAADLVRFQQAYQAAAKVIAAARDMFDTLLAAASR